MFSVGVLRLDSQNYFFKILNELTNINFIFIKAKRKKVIIAKAKIPKLGIPYLDTVLIVIDVALWVKGIYDFFADDKK